MLFEETVDHTVAANSMNTLTLIDELSQPRIGAGRGASHFFRHGERRAIGSCQELVGLGIVHELFTSRIKSELIEMRTAAAVEANNRNADVFIRPEDLRP